MITLCLENEEGCDAFLGDRIGGLGTIARLVVKDFDEESELTHQ